MPERLVLAVLFFSLKAAMQLEKKEGEFSAKTRKEKDETTSIAVEIIYESLWLKKYSKMKDIRHIFPPFWWALTFSQ